MIDLLCLSLKKNKQKPKPPPPHKQAKTTRKNNNNKTPRPIGEITIFQTIHLMSFVLFPKALIGMLCCMFYMLAQRRATVLARELVKIASLNLYSRTDYLTERR